MPIYYKGAGVGTYWHKNDARTSGFTPHSPGILPTHHRLMLHVARGSVTSPYISLTRSYGIAWGYAVNCGEKPTRSDPGFVCEVELDSPLPRGVDLLDPVIEVANNAPGPLDRVPYQHDGSTEFLLGVVDPARMKKHLKAPCRQPPPGGGTARPANLSSELETLVRAMRDAEIIAVGTIPAACIRSRFDVW